MLSAGDQQATSSVLYTTSCKHSLVLLRMGEIIGRNMFSSLKFLIKLLFFNLVACLYHCNPETLCILCEDKTHENSNVWEKIETVLCAAVGTASHQHGLEACTVYGDRTVCICRHSKASAWVRSMYCVWRPYCVRL